MTLRDLIVHASTWTLHRLLPAPQGLERRERFHATASAGLGFDRHRAAPGVHRVPAGATP
ncbi:hypothetical protein ABZ714_17925 [Streptomyces sp. NPDC006798]|uniref:hypothetical protein n=1 Tax=Streptomyces sp. NPDC006798 TaxID=3155462 RepID=UPI0033E85ED4